MLKQANRRNVGQEGQGKHLTGFFHEISLMVARLFNRRVRHIGLTRSQWQILYLLNRTDGLTQTQLADRLVTAKAPLGKSIDRLEQDGWVQRQSDAQDRRVKRVFVTDRVAPLIEPLAIITEEISAIATRGFSDAEQRTLFELLARVHDNLANVPELT